MNIGTSFRRKLFKILNQSILRNQVFVLFFFAKKFAKETTFSFEKLLRKATLILIQPTRSFAFGLWPVNVTLPFGDYLSEFLQNQIWKKRRDYGGFAYMQTVDREKSIYCIWTRRHDITRHCDLSKPVRKICRLLCHIARWIIFQEGCFFFISPLNLLEV